MGADKNNSELRLRRTKSVTQVENFSEKQNKLRETQPDSPCHKPRDSLLSSSSVYSTYRGVLNLCILLLVLSTAQVTLESITKYGILIDPLQWLKVFVGSPFQSPPVLIICGLNVAACVSLLIEKALAKGIVSESIGRVLTVLLLTAEILIPPLCVYNLEFQFVESFFVLGIVILAFLKLVSYHMVNYWCRQSPVSSCKSRRSASAERRKPRRSSSESISDCILVTYPNNLNLRDMFYFLFAPTLCYELNFPRSARIRKRFLIKRIIEMLFILQLILGLGQQWLMPTFNNFLKSLQDMDYSSMLMRLLKLSVPSHFIWLMFFYWYFHSVLNTIAEVLRFADRQFYNDWWNAETMQYFWQNWNIPVHRWFVRHIYKPMLYNGFTKTQASLAVFFVSGFFHEYLVSISLRIFRVWMFLGMVAQFANLGSKYSRNQYGNIAVWLSFIIGQPICILVYYHDYYVIHHQNMDASA